MTNYITLYDSTLRDGAQTQGVDFNVVDKQEICAHLDELGIDYIEGGWPGANPTDDAFFNTPLKLNKSRISAFGMTRRPSTSAENDPGLNALINTGVGAICIVGKTWDFHVTEALGITLEDNLAMIADSIAYIASKNIEVLFDAEHFFDAIKTNENYALKVIETAYKAGAKWVVLCDTNGGTLPHEIDALVTKATSKVAGEYLGIHCHNDTENAVANSLAAVRAGARQIQGTVNGYGERCGNANLISLIPTLKYKMGYDIGIGDDAMKRITQIAASLDDRLNRPRYRHAAYVGSSAFAHKGGLHVSAVLKNPTAYEHIDPEIVGNERLILVSDQAGRSNMLNRLKKLGLKIDDKDPKVTALLDLIKEQESQGFAYDSADASFELLAKRHLADAPHFFFRVNYFKVTDERRWETDDQLITTSEAVVDAMVNQTVYHERSTGNGPVNALNLALKKALSTDYPELEKIKLVDYKVRIMKPEKGTGAITRVEITSENDIGKRWTTIGVSENILDASYNALKDAFDYYLQLND